TPRFWIACTSATDNWPDRYGSSPKYSKLRPLRGTRVTFTPGASMRFSPRSATSWPAIVPKFVAAAVSQVADIASAEGSAVAGWAGGSEVFIHGRPDGAALPGVIGARTRLDPASAARMTSRERFIRHLAARLWIHVDPDKHRSSDVSSQRTLSQHHLPLDETYTSDLSVARCDRAEPTGRRAGRAAGRPLGGTPVYC